VIGDNYATHTHQDVRDWLASRRTGHWNEHPRPFAWIKDADEILTSINHAQPRAKDLTDHYGLVAAAMR
jgi:hypothetical protein